MTQLTEDKRELRQYLLGLLPEEEQQRIEQRLLTETDFFEELLLNEEELIDLYLSGALSAAELESFESHFLSTPERQRKLRFARSFASYVQRRGAVQPATPAREERRATWTERWRALWQGQRWAVPALALVIIAVVAGAFWLTRQRQPRTYAPLALNITTGATRGDSGAQQAPRVKLPLGADALRLFLRLPPRTNVGRVHRAELMDGTGETESLPVEEIDVVEAQSVSVVIPASRLRSGQYTLHLFETGADGAEERIEGSYFFIVE